jgi:kinesin family member 5
VEGLNDYRVKDLEDCLEVMKRGEKNRIVRQTSMNAKSSRSHTIFQLLFEQQL